MEFPLVSVVCLCYNHEAFVREAIASVLSQTYANIQVIVVDDCSTDGSVAALQEATSRHPQPVQHLFLKQNVGNCSAFNAGLKLVAGDFVIDFSTDDVMEPDRIEKQVSFFMKQSERVGVVFTDAVYIDENGTSVKNHYDYLFS